MPSTPSSAADAVRRFWDRYLELPHKQGIKPPADRWSAIRVEVYIKANPERCLVEQTPDDVRRYLSDLGGIGRINDWQFRQSVDAIQKLFELVGVPWLREVECIDHHDLRSTRGARPQSRRPGRGQPAGQTVT